MSPRLLLLLGLLGFGAVGCAKNAGCPSASALCAEELNPPPKRGAKSPGTAEISQERSFTRLPSPERVGETEKIENNFPQRDEKGVLELNELIQQALQSNPDVASALERIHIADAALAGARAEFFPRLSVSESYGISDNPVQTFMFQLNQAQLNFDQDFNDPSLTDNFHTQVLAQYNLYSGGRQMAAKRAAAAEREAAVSGLEGVQNQLVFRVTEGYYRLLQAHELLQIRREAIEQVEHHLAIVQTRLRAGTAVKSDVLSVEVRLAEVQEALIAARNRFELAWMVLDNVVGVPVPREELPQTVPPAPGSERVSELETLIEEALRSRPEIGRLARKREAASAHIRAARAAHYPTLDLTAHYDAFTGDLASGDTNFFVGLVAQLTLFDGGRTRSQIQQAQARLHKLNAQQRGLLSDIELDVRRAYLQLQEARGRLRVATGAVKQARESLREIEIRYRAQMATLTELIDAQVALSRASARLANAQAGIEIARSDLERAAGRLSDAFTA